jgi:hypothetical protein
MTAPFVPGPEELSSEPKRLGSPAPGHPGGTPAPSVAPPTSPTTVALETMVGGTQQDASATPQPATATSPDYESMTLADLRDLAAQRDITGRSGMSKDELIAALKGA